MRWIPWSVLMEEVSRKNVSSRKEMSDIEPVFNPGVFPLAMMSYFLSLE